MKDLTGLCTLSEKDHILAPDERWLTGLIAYAIIPAYYLRPKNRPPSLTKEVVLMSSYLFTCTVALPPRES